MLSWFATGSIATTAVLIVAGVGIVLMLERAYGVALQSRINGRAFIERIVPLAHNGHVDEAIRVCVDSRAPLPDVALLILRSRDADELDLRDIAHAASLSVLPQLTRRVEYLTTCAIVAVLLGFLGLVAKVHAALVLSPSASDHTVVFMSALSEGLDPVGWALVSAAALVAGRAYILARANVITTQVNELTARLINALAARPDVRLGHR